MISDRYKPKEVNILLMDGDRRYVRTIRRQLEKGMGKKFRLFYASGFEEGCGKLKVMRFDVLLLSLNLPDAIGRRALARVRHEHSELPVVMLVRNKDKSSIANYIHGGAQDCIFRNELSTSSLWRTIVNAIECKKVQLHLAEREILKFKFLETSLDGIVSMDESGKIVEFNRAAEEIFGFKRAHLVGQTLANKIIPERFRLAHERGLKEFLKTGNGKILGKRVEMTALRSDGTEFPIELSVVPMLSNGRHFFTSFIRDLSQKKQVEKDLKAAKEAADSANKAKSAFLANMSHEIRTPLGVILGFTELLLDPSINEENKRIYGETIKRSGEMLSQLIDDILDLAKIESGKLQVDMRTIMLEDLLSEISDIAGHLAQRRGIRFELIREPDLPKQIFTDPLRIKQILINIVGNAIKFTSDGWTKLRVRSGGKRGQLQIVEFEVEDTGVGIDSSQVNRLFTVFSQLDMSAAKKYAGTGLGLVLSKNLATMLGGDVRLVRSALGEGSTFAVTITSDESQILKSRSSRMDHMPIFLKKDKSIKLNGARILLAEDSPDNQILFSSLLKMSGALVDVVSNGREVLSLASVNNYHVILMDLQMPEVDGYEATRVLRSRGYNRPIIALTAHVLNEEIKKCEATGFDDHLSKPVGRNALIEKIYQYLPKNVEVTHGYASHPN